MIFTAVPVSANDLNQPGPTVDQADQDPGSGQENPTSQEELSSIGEDRPDQAQEEGDDILELEVVGEEESNPLGDENDGLDEDVSLIEDNPLKPHPIAMADKFPLDDKVDRIAGHNRYATSAAISKRIFDDHSLVIVASGESFPDALAGSSLVQGTYPILLTGSKDLDPSVKEEIARLEPDRIILLGGENTISSAVVQELKGLGQVIRISGSDRYATSVKVAELTKNNGMLLADGLNFPDALAASSLANLQGQDIILTESKTLNPAIENYILNNSIGRLDIVGGENSISSDLARQLIDKGIYIADRHAGANRFATSVQIAERIVDIKGAPNYVVVANGSNFPDALASSILAQGLDAPILLVDKDRIDKTVIDFLDKYRESIDKVLIIGGESVVSPRVEELLRLSIVDGGVHPDELIPPVLRQNPYKPFNRGAKSDAIGLMQTKLKEMGYYRGDINSTYNGESEIAVRLFQYENDYPINPNVSEEVWEAILTLDGKPFSRENIGKVEMTIPFHSQNEKGAWVGCMPTSLLMAIQHKGHAKGMDLVTFLNNHVPRSPNGDPSLGFPGTPWNRDNRYNPRINPNVQLQIAESLGANASDLTGTPLYAIRDELYMGNPVPAIAIIFWNNPAPKTYWIGGQPRTIIENHHGFVITGYDPVSNRYKITDPYNDTRIAFNTNRGARYGHRFDYWELAQNLENSYNHERIAVSVWD